VKTLIALAIVIVVLFYIPMFKWLSEMMVSTIELGMLLYWIVLTLLAIIIGFKILERTLKGEVG